MKILVFGAGAIGTWLGATLGRSGQWVTLVGRSALVEAVNTAGVQVIAPDGKDWRTQNLRAVQHVRDAAAGDSIMSAPYDVILLCVKAYDVDAALTALQSHRDALFYPPEQGQPRTVLACLQNGVGSEERCADVFGAERVAAATTTSPVSMPAPGVVQVERSGGAVCLSPLSAQDSPAAGSPLAQFVAALKQADLPVAIYRDARSLKWSKLLLNVMSNASSAILDMLPAEIYGHAGLFQMERRMLREVVAVTRALHIPLLDLPRFPAAKLAWALRAVPTALLQPVLVRQLARGRGNKWPSFHHDVAQHTGKTEVMWLNGAGVEQGHLNGVPTPVNAALTQVLLEIVTGKVDAAEWRHQPDKLLALIR
jgi:2-dehydropantoate 2-reductase